MWWTPESEEEFLQRQAVRRSLGLRVQRYRDTRVGVCVLTVLGLVLAGALAAAAQGVDIVSVLVAAAVSSGGAALLALAGIFGGVAAATLLLADLEAARRRYRHLVAGMLLLAGLTAALLAVSVERGWLTTPIVAAGGE